MMNAGVDNEIIKAYIHNSFMYWTLSSQDIINLKQQGFPSDLVAAMLQRDAQLRDQAMQAAQANPNPPSTTSDPGTNAPTVVTPTYDSGQFAGTAAYAYPVDYGYSYPAWGGWGGWGWGSPWWGWGGWWGWPCWGGGFVFFNSFGHCNFNKNFHVNTFHNNNFHNNNFHNNNFHGNNFHGNTAWNGHNGTGTWNGNRNSSGTWRGNGGTTMARGNNSGFRGGAFATTRTMSGFAGTRSGAFSTPSFSGRMSSPSRSFGSAGMGSMGHFGGGSMGHMGGGHMGGGFGGGGGMHMGGGGHMGGGFGGGHGGGGGHR
jgi:hypothetical protein